MTSGMAAGANAAVVNPARAAITALAPLVTASLMRGAGDGAGDGFVVPTADE